MEKSLIHVAHIVQPISETELGGADTHVFDLALFQKSTDLIEPIVLIRRNKRFQKRIQELGIKCFCGSYKDSSFKYVKWLNKQLEDEKIDLIHSHGYDASYQMVMLKKIYPKKWKKIPVVITSHGWIENTLYLKWKTYLDFCCHRFSRAHIVCAEGNLSRIKKYKNQIHKFIPNGISFKRFQENKEVKKLDEENNNYRVAFVGRLAPEKRLDVFLKAAFEVLSKRRDVEYLIVGSGPEASKLKNIVTQSGFEDKIRFLGQIEAIERVYKEIDILVMTSDTESTPRAMLEAMYNEIPVISTNVGSISQIVIEGKNGFLVEKEDWKSIARYTDTILSDKKLMEEFKKKAKIHIENNFSIQKMGKEIINIYNKILKNDI